ncbi:TPA: DsbA family protein [Vibrio parahaemolyticus]|uniref:DsbA family protein n=1 Tax=Vibrio parahaemolyticus TaxID=670 RepID=UPI00070698D5|nr:DsbA family protein [Vibrio parahaemolyticus]ALG53438.1 Thioredoxin-like protein [Vibrio parahaemolyticus]MBE4057929.1 DsbA family protein [Vibrio parahaemolyticus]MBE4123777.1 DsbA family protein [Vibrio parahaemolyticus]MBE4155027.1 DsbA family protein [Vibrio parahaemolyticus]MDF4405887.1 DsbA family protein [Vibrio parahaemolyticus]
MVTVHYFLDPMCGWCYGASPLIEALMDTSQFKVELHPGGMIEKRAIESEFRQHIINSDARIATETGATFGEAYLQRVKSEDTFVLDSYLPTQAILSAEKMGLNPWHMLKAIQSAHYQLGLKVNEASTLKAIAESLGLANDAWEQNMTLSEAELNERIHSSRQLMRQLHVGGYPTLIAEVNGECLTLPHSTYYDKPAQWKLALQKLQ